MSLIGSTNEEKIWNYLKAKGLPDCGIAGLMGNLYAESCLIPTNLQNSYEKALSFTDAAYTAAVDNGTYQNFVKDSAGYGLAQWTYWSRKKNLLDFAKKKGKSIGDLEMQLDFLWNELQGYKAVISTLKTAKTVKAASDSVLLNFERPADQSEAVKNRRAGFGQKFYDKYAADSTAQKGVPGVSKCYASAVIAVAIGELGYVEKATNSQLDNKTANPGRANWTKYARDFDEKYPKWYNGKKNGYEWCDMFVDWCFVTAFGYENALRLLCQPERSCGAGCTWSAKYYKQKGQFFTSNPQVGDQIFFGTSIDNCTHTGLVEKVDASKVYTIEGNTSNKCARRSYALNSAKIVGYGRPKYDGAGTTTPVTPTKPSAGGQTSGADYKIGDIVQFKGKTHYVSSQATSGVPCKPGKAKVTSIAKGAKHPYHLVNQGGGCTVYGWVNAADIGADSGAEQAVYTVVAGDSLWGIAQKRLGNGNRYKEIMTLNGLSSTVIRPGQKLKLPS
jgi:LysM repeat protein